MTLRFRSIDSAAHRRRALSVCIGAALAIGAVHTPATAIGAPAEFLQVTNCDDSGPGSLRDTLASASYNDVIQLGTLPCSVITLTSGELETNLTSITIEGYGQTISANGGSRVIEHGGAGQLTIEFLTIEDGVASGSSHEVGGCIASQGDVYLLDTRVQNCSVYATSGSASEVLGGGVYSRGKTTLAGSVVADNTLDPGGGSFDYTYAKGGGVFAGGGLRMDISTISGNVVDGSGAYIDSGGFYSAGPLYIRYSTVSGNSAYFAGAGVLSDDGSSFIKNSTISGNAAQSRVGGIWSSASILEIWSSTIAFNTAQQPSYAGAAGGGIVEANGYFALRDSIAAGNKVGNYAQDVAEWNPGFSVTGRNNLIIAANVPLPDDTLRVDPMLAPLADNGGATLTHALLSGSPAIDAGGTYDYDFTYDQRGFGYPRREGPRPDIGAFESRPPDLIFQDGFD